MVILFFGDIVGKPGREAVKKVLPALCTQHQPDFVVANIENIVHGMGVNREKVEEMRAAGVDAFTAGDHVFDVSGASELLGDHTVPIVRPLNWIGGVPGRGWRIVEKDGKRLLLLNALGRAFMKVTANDFFEMVECALREASQEHYDASFLDFHADATSEKRAIAEYFDGRISVVVGTHTHVQTNDAQTLPQGTGFLTDVGMCGGQDGIIGGDKRVLIQKFRTQIPTHHDPAESPCEVHACVAIVENGRTTMGLIRLRNVEV